MGQKLRGGYKRKDINKMHPEIKSGLKRLILKYILFFKKIPMKTGVVFQKCSSKNECCVWESKV